MAKIEGALATANAGKASGGLLSRLFGFLKSALDSFTQMGIDYYEDTESAKKAEETEKEKAEKEGRKPQKIVSKFYTLTLPAEEGEQPEKVKLMLTPTKNGNLLGMLTFADGEVRRTEKALPEAELDKWIKKALNYVGADSYEDKQLDEEREYNLEYSSVGECTTIRASLQKIESATDTSIELVAIDPAVEPHRAIRVLNQLASDSAFVQTLTADPQTYEIAETDDAYDVATCGECVETADEPTSTRRILQDSVICLGQLMQVEWNITGPDSTVIHDRCEQLIWCVRELVQWAAGKVGTYGSVPGPAELLRDAAEYPEYPNGITGADALDMLKAISGHLLDLLDCLYCNFDGPSQLTISQMTKDLDALHTGLVLSTK